MVVCLAKYVVRDDICVFLHAHMYGDPVARVSANVSSFIPVFDISGIRIVKLPHLSPVTDKYLHIRVPSSPFLPAYRLQEPKAACCGRVCVLDTVYHNKEVYAEKSNETKKAPKPA